MPSLSGGSGEIFPFPERSSFLMHFRQPLAGVYSSWSIQRIQLLFPKEHRQDDKGFMGFVVVGAAMIKGPSHK